MERGTRRKGELRGKQNEKVEFVAGRLLETLCERLQNEAGWKGRKNEDFENLERQATSVPWPFHCFFFAILSVKNLTKYLHISQSNYRADGNRRFVDELSRNRMAPRVS